MENAFVFDDLKLNVFGVRYRFLYKLLAVLRAGFHRGSRRRPAVYRQRNNRYSLYSPRVVAVDCYLAFCRFLFLRKKEEYIAGFVNEIQKHCRLFFSKGMAVFFSAALVVLVPFLINMLLNLIAFPTASVADYTNVSTDQTIYYVEPYITNGLFPRLLALHPYLYNCLFWIAISLFSGLLSVTAYVISYFVRRNRIWVLVSVFILNNLIALASDLCVPKLNFAFFNYLFAFDQSEGKKLWMFFLLLAVLILVVAVLSHKAIAKLDNVLCDVRPTKKI